MSSWFENGRIVDVILAGMALEAVCLVFFHRRTGRGVRPGDALSNIGSGACLLLAMRLALAGAWWGFVGISLLGALAGHIVVLAAQLGRRAPHPTTGNVTVIAQASATAFDSAPTSGCHVRP